MGSEWPLVALGDVASEITVGWVGSMSDEYVMSGVPFLRSLNVSPYRIVATDLKYISPEFHKRISKSSLHPGDLVVVRTGRPGTAAVISEDWPEANCSDLVIIRPSDNLDTRFAMYYLNSAVGRGAVDARLVGSVQSHFNIGDASRLKLRLPSINEQQAIARILGTLDDKIELNRRENETLEAMAQAHFKSWFVDFDPVRAKAAGQQPVGMDAAAAALFPDGFEESEMGDVPRGWTVAPLSQHFEAVRGLSYKGSGLSEIGTPLHNLNSIYEGGGYKYEGIKFYTGEYQERHLAKAGDLIVANTEQGHDRLLIGYPALIPARYQVGLYSHHLYRVRPCSTSYLTSLFLYFLLRLRSYHDTVAGYANGTTVNMLPVDALERPLFTAPPPELLQRFEEIAEPTLTLIEHNRSESDVLAVIRDTLLPKLLSGEVRVREAEQSVVEALS